MVAGLTLSSSNSRSVVLSIVIVIPCRTEVLGFMFARGSARPPRVTSAKEPLTMPSWLRAAPLRELKLPPERALSAARSELLYSLPIMKKKQM
jgi:hypothetical protein